MFAHNDAIAAQNAVIILAKFMLKKGLIDKKELCEFADSEINRNDSLNDFERLETKVLLSKVVDSQ